MKLAVRETKLQMFDMHTRMPFRYGIATLEHLHHVFVRVLLEVDGRPQWGIAADHLPPKWFTKDPTTTYEQDVVDMLAVIHHARQIPLTGTTVHDLWQQLYAAQKQWATGYPPLLWNFGVSLVERALIDAFCRATHTTFSTALNTGALGVTWQNKPLRQLIIRHTVGLGDPLTGPDKLNDDLPQTLESCIRRYGLTHFKIKLCGNPDADLDRLRQLSHVLPANAAFTLDGNEQYKTLDDFITFWETVPPLPGLIFVEQPLHRDVALTIDLKTWRDRPPIIIDESDAELASFPTALDLGYAGTSHKNCKGVFKSIANAKLARDRRAILSGEDLANVGPVALLQDLAVAATLGIPHLERNGHHYFRGVSLGAPELLKHHGDLYQDCGFTTLDIQNGRINVGSVIDAPFGMAFTSPEN